MDKQLFFFIMKSSERQLTSVIAGKTDRRKINYTNEKWMSKVFMVVEKN